jgi:RNA polymerase sigma factor (sigma-70 family)
MRRNSTSTHPVPETTLPGTTRLVAASNLNSAYAAYTSHPSEQNLAVLFRAVKKYATRIARDFRNADPEDAAQAATIQVWTKLSSFTGTSPFRSWMRLVLLNHLRDWYRREARQGYHSVEVSLEGREPTPDLRSPCALTVSVSSLTQEQRHTLSAFLGGSTTKTYRCHMRTCPSRYLERSDACRNCRTSRDKKSGPLHHNSRSPNSDFANCALIRINRFQTHDRSADALWSAPCSRYV